MTTWTARRLAWSVGIASIVLLAAAQRYADAGRPLPRAKALEAAGSTSPKAVRNAIAKVNFESLYGHIAFQPSGQIALPEVMIQVQKDKVVPVYGQKGLINKPLYPMPAWSKR